MIDKPLEILGLIPARGGSKGLPGKNIRPLSGKPLIAYTIESALESKYLNRVIVVTDSDEIAEVSKAAGAEVPFKRPAEVSGDKTHAFAVYKYAASWLAENENYRPDIIANIFCTTAMRSTEDIDACMEMMVRTDCDWCFTVNEIEHHPYRAVTVDGSGRMKPFFDIPREMMWANRQELPEMYRFNGGVIAGKTKHIMEHEEYNIDNLEFADVDVRCVKMPVARALDIDTEMDFRIVEMAMEKALKDSQ